MEVKNMLFKKKEYLNWDQYSKIVDNIEHWCFVSSQFKDYWRTIK